MQAINCPKFIQYLNQLPPNSSLELECPQCGVKFIREKKRVQGQFSRRGRKQKKIFCSANCAVTSAKANLIELTCNNCQKEFTRLKSQTLKSKNHFCSRSCAATYNNVRKQFGSRRSKLECWIQLQLEIRYPSLEIKYNSKDNISSELDIYIPSLSLAFELNGIVHCKPIYGMQKLKSIQTNDRNKKEKCIAQGIELIIIDTSTYEKFKPSTAIQYFNYLTNEIDRRQGL